MAVTITYLADYSLYRGDSADAVTPVLPASEASAWEYTHPDYPDIATVQDALDKLFTMYPGN